MCLVKDSTNWVDYREYWRFAVIHGVTQGVAASLTKNAPECRGAAPSAIPLLYGQAPYTLPSPWYTCFTGNEGACTAAKLTHSSCFVLFYFLLFVFVHELKTIYHHHCIWFLKISPFISYSLIRYSTLKINMFLVIHVTHLNYSFHIRSPIIVN